PDWLANTRHRIFECPVLTRRPASCERNHPQRASRPRNILQVAVAWTWRKTTTGDLEMRLRRAEHCCRCVPGSRLREQARISLQGDGHLSPLTCLCVALQRLPIPPRGDRNIVTQARHVAEAGERVGSAQLERDA